MKLYSKEVVMDKTEKWFKAISDLDVGTVDSMLNAGEITPCAQNSKRQNGVTLLVERAKAAYEHNRIEEEEKALTILAALIAHGENQSELHHECGEISNLNYRICKHIIDDSIQSGKTHSVEMLFQSGQLWSKNDNDQYRSQFLRFVQERNHPSAQGMLNDGLVGIRPEQ